MPANVILNPGAGGATLGTDQVAGVDYQIVKISFSTAGSAPVQVDAANGLPVVVAALPLPAGAATLAGQAAINTTLGTPMQQTGGSLSVTNFPATQPVSATALPLPANAAQETGGNLASTVTLLTYLQRLVDLETQILAVLQASRLQQAAAFGTVIEPSCVTDEFTLN